MKVAKFGGSSVASGAKIAQVINILNNDNKRQVVVVSAPGKRSKSDTKVTDLLIKYANLTLRKQNYEKIQAQIYARYAEIGEYFDLSMQGLNEIKALINDLPTHTFPNRDYLMAAFKAHGEFLNAKLLTMIMKKQGFKVRLLTPRQAGLVVTGSPNDASVNPETYVNLRNLELDPTEKIIFPGFYGISPSGNIATFSRGGSDITGAILARGFNAELYENFTDVDAIFSANPAIVSHPQPISKMTYREMRELSYAGFLSFTMKL